MDHGDSITPWSVGKYAKRSATIHLNSQDLMPHNEHQFADAMIVDQNAVGMLLRDIGGQIRTAIPLVPSSAVIHLPGGAENKVDVGLGVSGDEANPGFLSNNATFTDLCQLNVPEAQALAGTSVFRIIPVPETGFAVNGQGDLTDAATATAIRDHAGGTAGTAMFKQNGHKASMLKKGSASALPYSKDKTVVLIPLAQFPAETDELDDRERLCTGDSLMSQDDAATFAIHNRYFDQANKGYRIELFYSSNLNDLNGDGSFKNVANDSDWAPLVFSRVFFKRFIEQDGSLKVVVELDDNPNLDLLFSDAEYDTLRNAADDVVEFTKYQAGVRQIRWNMRRMPTASVTATEHFPPGQNHCNYEVTIPNTIGYPEHKRCLVQVQSLSLYPGNEFHMMRGHGTLKQVTPVQVGVVLEGVGVQNVVATGTGVVSDASIVASCPLGVKGHRYIHQKPVASGGGVDLGHRVLSYAYENTRPILTDGVLISSPFGQQMRVKLINLTSNEVLNTTDDELSLTSTGSRNSLDDVINNPTHLTLKLLFLDDDDLPMR